VTRTEGGPSDLAKLLTGLVVVVTRPASEDEALSRTLADLGADVVRLPMIAFEPPVDPEPLARALDRWEEYDWVAFTSPRGVTWVAEALVARGSDPTRRPPRRLAVVGPSTATAARGVGWAPELVPERFDAEGLLEAIDRRGESFSGVRVLLPVADVARATLAAGLRARGAHVDVVIAYRSDAPKTIEEGLIAGLLASASPTLVTFTSPSAARHLFDLEGATALGLPVAAIGPVTAEAARGLGYRVVAVPEYHTLDGLVGAVRRWWGER
jgi:uroporphyrinogen-III synthase